jgi:hypothetical protein
MVGRLAARKDGPEGPRFARTDLLDLGDPQVGSGTRWETTVTEDGRSAA